MEGVACMAGVVAVVLPPGEQVLVPRPRHRTGGKGSAELVAPGGQPAEPEPRQGGVIVPPAGQAATATRWQRSKETAWREVRPECHRGTASSTTERPSLAQ